MTAKPRRLPPASVVTALAALGLVVAVQLALALLSARSGAVGWGQFVFAAVFATVLLVGVARGSRLAWLWTRGVTLVLAVLELAALAVGAVRHQVGAGQLAIGALGLVLPLFVTSYALSRRSAYTFFDLVCPECGTRTSLGATLLFREARCHRCNAVW